MTQFTTPDEAWASMVAGNARFVAGEPQHPHQDVERRNSVAAGQTPRAALFGCADSRLAAEIIFDLGLGDLFVVRNAGQVAGDSIVGSLEYAVEVLKVPLIVVLGHDSCGAVGAAIEVLFQILPVALGLRTTIDAGLARVFFSWTLHAIVYFWLIPAYIAYYTIVPRAIGGRLYSDSMARISFILFLVVAMPIGLHHLFTDPQVGSGFKFVQTVFTALVSVPTLLTVFTICASIEIAGRLRGGKGAFGWIAKLPWDNPQMLAVAFSFVMLGLGGAGGLINMSYQLDQTIHNTQWITGHFHLIFGGAIVIMYFAIAYDLWPQLTGRALTNWKLMRWQLWLWFIGMMVTTLPWHFVGIMGMPRRMAYFDYSDPAIAPQAILVVISVFGALILVVSGILFFIVLLQGHRGERITRPEEYRFSTPVHEPLRLPVALNSFALWVVLMIALTVTNYGYPIAQLIANNNTSVPAIPIGALR